jgi:manganese-transporting P-type ATPase
LFASDVPREGVIEWCDIDDKKVCDSKSADDLKDLASKYLLCIAGNWLEKVILWQGSPPELVMEAVHVFSRTSPAQKGIIVGLLNSMGHKTLMCGDGTNDVGSLKRADVGLAIVNNKEPNKEDKKAKKALSPWIDKKKLEGKSFAEKQKM